MFLEDVAQKARKSLLSVEPARQFRRIGLTGNLLLAARPGLGHIRA
jgi:hypothetical protein